MSQATRGHALSAEEQPALQFLIEKLGEHANLAELNVSRLAPGRVLAGLPVQQGMLVLVRAGLGAPNVHAAIEVDGGHGSQGSQTRPRLGRST